MTTTQTSPVAAPSGAHIADPGALGLGAFALTTFVLSMVNSGILPEAAEPAVFGLALAYGGGVQIIAGVFEFLKGNTFGATAFSSYGAFWLAFWWLTSKQSGNAAAMGADAGKGVGIFLLAWAIFSLYRFVASFRTNTVLVVVFAVLTITFVFLSLGKFNASEGLTHVGGYIGLVTAVIAWYGSFATVLNATWKRTVLPVGSLAA
jgi:succinate-acetate transporter protein